MKKKLAFLQSIGFPKAVAEMIVKNEDFGDDVDIDGTTSEVRTAIGESFKNDGEFLKPIKAAERKAILAGREKNLRKLAGDHLTDDEWNGLPENSRLDDGMKLVMDKLAAVRADPKKSPDDKDKEIATLNKQLQEFGDQVKKYKEEIVPAAERKALEVEDGFHIREQIKEVATADGRQFVLPKKGGGLLYEDLTKLYDISYDRTKSAVVLKKKGEDVLAYDEKDRSKPLELGVAVAAIGEKEGYFVKNNGGGNGNGNNGNGGGHNAPEKPKFAFPGAAAAAERLSKAPAGK